MEPMEAGMTFLSPSDHEHNTNKVKTSTAALPHTEHPLHSTPLRVRMSTITLRARVAGSVTSPGRGSEREPAPLCQAAARGCWDLSVSRDERTCLTWWVWWSGWRTTVCIRCGSAARRGQRAADAWVFSPLLGQTTRRDHEYPLCLHEEALACRRHPQLSPV